MASLMPIQRQIGYWMTVSEDGIRDVEFEEKLAKELKRSVLIARLGQIFGWVSAVGFFGGLFLAGQGMLDLTEPHRIATQVEAGQNQK